MSAGPVLELPEAALLNRRGRLPGFGARGQFGLWLRLVLAGLMLAAPLVLLGAMVTADWLMGSAGSHRNYAYRFALPSPVDEVSLPDVQGPADVSRPLVVIDAGHGGHDPGAGQGPVKEKDLTLGLALALRDQLLASGTVRVALTRSDDRYLLLEDRSGIARRLKADLFLSIHADSVEAGVATGATVFTLSSRGSSEEAEALAKSENSADIVNGIELARNSDAVKAILVDLSQRRTGALSQEFAQLLLREGASRIRFRERALQSAAFVVLKSPDVPSALFEAGYISNPDDAARLASEQGRANFAEVTAKAIRVYFARMRANADAQGTGQGALGGGSRAPVPVLPNSAPAVAP
jgi:N-acetylmuramoyl-L-alanine amidase